MQLFKSLFDRLFLSLVQEHVQEELKRVTPQIVRESLRAMNEHVARRPLSVPYFIHAKAGMTSGQMQRELSAVLKKNPQIH